MKLLSECDICPSTAEKCFSRTNKTAARCARCSSREPRPRVHLRDLRLRNLSASCVKCNKEWKRWLSGEIVKFRGRCGPCSRRRPYSPPNQRERKNQPSSISRFEKPYLDLPRIATVQDEQRLDADYHDSDSSNSDKESDELDDEEDQLVDDTDEEFAGLRLPQDTLTTKRRHDEVDSDDKEEDDEADPYPQTRSRTKKARTNEMPHTEPIPPPVEDYNPPGDVVPAHELWDDFLLESFVNAHAPQMSFDNILHVHMPKVLEDDYKHDTFLLYVLATIMEFTLHQRCKVSLVSGVMKAFVAHVPTPKVALSGKGRKLLARILKAAQFDASDIIAEKILDMASKSCPVQPSFAQRTMRLPSEALTAYAIRSATPYVNDVFNIFFERDKWRNVVPQSTRPTKYLTMRWACRHGLIWTPASGAKHAADACVAQQVAICCQHGTTVVGRGDSCLAWDETLRYPKII